MDNLDDIFLNNFLKEFDEKEQRKILISKEERNIASQKSEQLEPIRVFLQKFKDLEIFVYHNNRFSKEINLKESNFYTEQAFDFYDIDSSPTWAPGISIAFDHPAQVEIAIPNKIDDEGCISIRVATNHPDSNILEQKFFTIESACQALAKFLGKNTLRMNSDPKKVIDQINKNNKHKNSQAEINFNKVPNTPPEVDTPPSLKDKKINSEILKKILEQNENKEQ